MSCLILSYDKYSSRSSSGNRSFPLLSVIGRQGGSALRALHLNLHPRDQTRTMITMLAWGLHQPKGQFLGLSLGLTPLRFLTQLTQTNRTLILLPSFLQITSLLVIIVIGWLQHPLWDNNLRSVLILQLQQEHLSHLFHTCIVNSNRQNTPKG